MRWLAMFACLIVAVLAAHTARAQTRVELLGTWPAGDNVTLANGQNFYLHLRYHSDAPTHIWARPYFEGKPANAGSNPSRIYPAGSGEALGWFFLSDPGAQVDEVRIRAGDGSRKGTHLVATYPVVVTTNDEPAPASSPPTWVTTLLATDKAASDAAYQKAMNTPPSAGEALFFSGFMLAVLALVVLGIAWPIWGVVRWRGGWRLAAVVPLAVMAFVVLRIMFDTARDPTSHNLWPFEILMWGGPSFIWILVVALVHKVAGARRQT